ncbi:MAG TPA: tetratricopeptide repeat protein [Bryobacteraceae bacterium]|nr:tetratricopeptide repeat protein [Bryobacteraceae bacterium]
MARVLKTAGLTCVFMLLTTGVYAQKAQKGQPADSSSKADSYYYYALGHLYGELAGAYGNKTEYYNKAVENYKLALKADPNATFIGEELSDLYIQSGRLREAVTEAEDALKQNPNDLNSRRILARIYTRLIGDPGQNRIDETMVKKAIEQYQKITEKDPKDVESWLMLGRLEKVAENSVEAQNAYKKALEADPNNEDALTGLAMVYADLGDSKAAAEMMQKAAEKDPNPRNLEALAQTYEQMKDFSLASETLRRALEQSPGNMDLKKRYARDLLFADQYEESLKVYKEIAASDPKDPEAELRLSEIYREKHDYPKAREAAQKAKEIAPDNIEIEYNEVKLLEAEGKLPEAISALKAILDNTTHKSYEGGQKENRIALLQQMAFLYRESEQWSQAIDAYRQIAEVDADKAGAAEAQIINTYRAAKDFTKAQQEADSANKKYPEDRALRAEYGSLLADMGKIDQAVSETKKLFDGKNDRETWIALAQIYEKGKNWPEMAKSLNQAEKLATAKDDKETISFLRGAMYEREKKYDQAEAEFRKVLEMNPSSASAMNYLGYMLADRNTKLPEAETLIRKALDQEPNNGAYLDSMGWVLFRQNKLPEAEESLRRALDLMSTDPTVHDHLADVYSHEGKIREAISQWQASLKYYDQSAPTDVDHEDMAKIQKKLDDAKVRLARETTPKQQ